MNRQQILYIVSMERAKIRMAELRREEGMPPSNEGPCGKMNKIGYTFGNIVEEAMDDYWDDKFEAWHNHGCNCTNLYTKYFSDGTKHICAECPEGGCMGCFKQEELEIEKEYKLLGVDFGDEANEQ